MVQAACVRHPCWRMEAKLAIVGPGALADKAKLAIVFTYFFLFLLFLRLLLFTHFGESFSCHFFSLFTFTFSFRQHSHQEIADFVQCKLIIINWLFHHLIKSIFKGLIYEDVWVLKIFYFLYASPTLDQQNTWILKHLNDSQNYLVIY